MEDTLESVELAHKIVAAAEDKQASNIVLLDTRNVCSLADYFVLCTAESGRQVEAVAEEIEHVLKKTEGILPRQREGTAGSGWVLLDYGDVIAHIFAPEERQLYDLDGLWSKAPTVVHIQ